MDLEKYFGVTEERFEKYTQDAERTNNPDWGWRKGYLHAVIGLNTELHEYIDHKDLVNMKEEIGDMWWYIAIGINALKSAGIHKDEFLREYEIGSNDLDRIKLVSWLQNSLYVALDDVKKCFFYEPVEEKVIVHSFYKSIDLILKIMKVDSVDIEELMETNINKLRARFPHKFNSEDALNRDLDAERKILEEGHGSN